jgi:ApbE superfamily uncharacterized protein (UPF0280 family)
MHVYSVCTQSSKRRDGRTHARTDTVTNLGDKTDLGKAVAETACNSLRWTLGRSDIHYRPRTLLITSGP